MKNSEENKEDNKSAAAGCLPLLQLLVGLFAVGYAVYILLTV